MFRCVPPPPSSLPLLLFSPQYYRDGDEQSMYFPASLEELKSLAEKLHRFKEEHFYIVLGFFSAAYLYKQSFAIPGSFFLVRR